ncbi:STAS domain-containing protein [Novosphingobium sp. TH158]|uniref:STAS domain-containing protein n=1 Tax=Novosphingobium sp. TH158 TaxID=2067455 RepID=UPI000C7D61F5|nr:STAS domain-containing protein [Novosphingobium sp. TH158]PLK26660.1 chemotaxis protein CheX [Novosphingobium sp. TH158]
MATLTLPPRCDRATVLALLPEFRSAAGEGPLEIDGTSVVQAGQALLQLLVSARRSSGGARITPSAELAETARLTGLHGLLFDGGAQ